MQHIKHHGNYAFLHIIYGSSNTVVSTIYVHTFCYSKSKVPENKDTLYRIHYWYTCTVYVNITLSQTKWYLVLSSSDVIDNHNNASRTVYT